MVIDRLRLWTVSALTVSALLAPGLTAAQATDDAPKPPEFSAELVSCLRTALGSAFVDVAQADHEPTDAEIEKGEPCFEQFGPKVDLTKQPKVEDLKFAPGTEKCLKETLGDGFRSEFASQKSKDQAKAFRSKTKTCFGKNVPGNGPAELPTEVRSCIVSAVGQAAADDMFKHKPPEPGSELFTKIESAQCFKNFGPPPGHDRPNLSAESKACVEKIMGHTFEETRSEPSEDQKQKIGKECFGGGGPGGPGGPQIPKEVQSCLSSAFGDQLEDLKKGPEFMTEEQKQKADACFRANNFNPGGPNGSGGPGGPAPDPKTEACIKNIAGSSRPENLSEDLKQKIGKECFGGGGPNGPGGPGGPGNLDPAKQACVEKITGGKDGRTLTDEQRQQIGRECFGGPNGPGGGPGPNGGPQQGQDPAREECIKRVTGGKNFDQQTEDDRQKVGRECFGNQGSGTGQPGQPNPGQFNDANRFNGQPNGQNPTLQSQPLNQPPGQPNGSNTINPGQSHGPNSSGSNFTETPGTTSGGSGTSGSSGSSGSSPSSSSGSSGGSSGSDNTGSSSSSESSGSGSTNSGSGSSQ
ncbi:hypothetical protein HY524_01430 [Candidatus Berkelbacteria bacterium]|nr:hypothetical protein [Candidatus Berkelbacteria bacterium]